jgi:antitoxin Phd
MQINTNNLVSINEANQNFSKIARLVDVNGAAVILKNNVPRYVILEYSQVQAEETAENEDIVNLGKRILKRNIEAFSKLDS